MPTILERKRPRPKRDGKGCIMLEDESDDEEEDLKKWQPEQGARDSSMFTIYLIDVS